MKFKHNSDSGAAALIAFLLTLIVAITFYHPYYFGDELRPFLSVEDGGGVFQTFINENKYKPRLIMNFLWSVIAVTEPSRFVAMLVVAGTMWLSAWAFIKLARGFGAPDLAAMLGAILLICSRYDIMIYFDYVSGSIESISLALFLWGLYLLSEPVLGIKISRLTSRTADALGLALWIAVVLVHERYAAGFLAISFAMLLREAILRWRSKAVVSKSPLSRQRIILAFLIAVLPLGLHVILVMTLSENSLLVGTADHEVSLDDGVIKAFGIYIANLFFGTNYGKNWFVGFLNQEHPWHKYVVLVSVPLFLAVWIFPWMKRGAVFLSLERISGILILISCLVAMIFVASLPGIELQQARWVLPMFALQLLALLAIFRGTALYAILTLMLASNIFFGIFGGLQMIANINASRMANSLATSLNSIDPPGTMGAMLLAAEPDTTWVLGDDGELFCRLNLNDTNCLMPKAAAVHAPAIDFGINSTQKALTSPPTYALVSKRVALAALGQGEGDSGEPGHILGWSGWLLSPHAKIQEGGLLVSQLSDNFLRVSASSLQDAMITYRAQSANGQKSEFRLQVNWHDSQDKFLSAQLEVVTASSEEQPFTTMLAVPRDAKWGYVYATLHDGETNPVLIRSITVTKP